MIGGVQGGYNWRLPSGLLFGVEADLTFPNYLASNSITALISTPRNDFVEQWDYVGTARGRIGYATSHWLFYATGGFAFMGERFVPVPAVGVEGKHIGVRLGWAAGAGVEYAFAPHWTVRLEYLYSQFERANVSFPSGIQYTSTNDLQMLRLGLNRKIDWPGSPKWSPKTDITDTESQPLGNPRPDHLSAAGLSGISRAVQRRQQPDAGAAGAGDLEQQPVSQHAALGRRRGLLQSRTAAGFWAQRHRRRSAASPTAKRRSRTSPTRITTPHGCSSARPFGFGGEQEELASGAVAARDSKVDVSRLTLQVGKFAVLDIFDGNAYAKDTRKDFINWSIWAPGAFDYSADKVGLTYGVTAELNQKQWALRARLFPDAQPSSTQTFRSQVFRSAAPTRSSWRRASHCSRSRASCAPSHGSTAPSPAAIAKR